MNRSRGRSPALLITAIATLGISLFWLLNSVPAHAVNQEEFIGMAGESAVSSQVEYGIPASVTVAQAILESAWGESDKARTINNYFGMKCHNGDPGPIATGCADFPTQECGPDGACWNTSASFRTYESVEQSFRDHGNKLRTSPRYQAAFNYTNDADQFIREVHHAGYATDPSYSDKIINVMQKYNLYRFNQ